MSILNNYRINFFGGIEVDVSVPNNKATYPVDGQKHDIFNPATSTLTDFIYKHGISDEEIIDMFQTPTEEGYFTNGGWNIYGQHSVTTQKVKVYTSGHPGAVTTDTPLANFDFSLLGSVNPDTNQAYTSSPVMVDLNPLGQTYSQIAVGGLLLGDPDKPLLYIQSDQICGNIGNSSGGLSFKTLIGANDAPGSSNFAGTWQVTFPITEDVKKASALSGNDEADQIIRGLLNTKGATGIVVNFSFFEMCPQMTTEEYNTKLAQRQTPRNPSVGRIIGTLSVACEGETANNPDGRLLISHIDNTERENQTAPAFACISKVQEQEFLSVNMSLAFLQSTFREDRAGFKAVPPKPAIDFGKLTIVGGKESTTYGPDYINYYQYGGIIDIPLDKQTSQSFASNPLVINGEKVVHNNHLLLKETSYRLYSSDIDVYVGDKAGDSKEITIQVRYLGGALDTDQTILLSTNENTPGFADYLDLDLDEGKPTGAIPVKAGATSFKYTIQVADNSPGKNDLDEMAGFYDINFNLGEAQQTINTRKFQYTNFDLVEGDPVTWELVYQHALRYHYLNFLGMSTVFPLNDAETILKHREGIKTRMSSRYWPTTLYMPIVRSMSPSQVRLINAFAFSEPWDPNKAI
ncbi:hypothetical protein L1D53_21845 [Vibrio alginolyticus]|uniref:hypothetical protein n=1 Tax=Vibrio alginolyticus TaxID=663 RepID=UPI001EFCA312|nr:hypothetical protein [Vibrio alginolyticus]MCG9766168.1 hypothetical protein [Vibrio alginolyticus]